MSILDQITPTRYLAYWTSMLLISWMIGGLIAFGLFRLTAEVRALRVELMSADDE